MLFDLLLQKLTVLFDSLLQKLTMLFVSLRQCCQVWCVFCLRNAYFKGKARPRTGHEDP